MSWQNGCLLAVVCAAFSARGQEPDDRQLPKSYRCDAQQVPVLPSVSVYDIPAGSYFSLESALAEPTKVKVLEVGDAGLEELPDLSDLVNLEVLTLYGNELSDLPASLRNCKQLKSINLFRNPLQKVPAVLFELSGLEEIVLVDDLPEDELAKLRGALPDAEIR